ncbi:MAG: endonuclease VIII [Bacilli bacterium]|nr:endonuclease VIII [Bacilli bacterium]
MMELPETHYLSQQLFKTIKGKTIVDVQVGHTPHRMVWYCGDPRDYRRLLVGKSVDTVRPNGSQIEIFANDIRILYAEGIKFAYCLTEDKIPEKHQLLLKFNDLSILTATVGLYGGLYVFRAGTFNNDYYLIAQEKPSPLSDAFTWEYFYQLFTQYRKTNISVKSFLATEQRIPGLGNGILQDILYYAGILPRRNLLSLSGNEVAALYSSLKTTIEKMTQLGGRSSETDLYGKPGGYIPIMSSHNKSKTCPRCQGAIIKETFLGGSVYYCVKCQK